MFDLRNYILKLLDGSIGKEPDYKVRENALKWFERGTLVQADIEAVDQLIDAQYMTDDEIDVMLEENDTYVDSTEETNEESEE